MRETSPVIAVMVTDEGNQALFGVICGRLLEIVGKQGAIPPPLLIIRKVADAERIVLVGCNKMAGPGPHPLRGGGEARGQTSESVPFAPMPDKEWSGASTGWDGATTLQRC